MKNFLLLFLLLPLFIATAHSQSNYVVVPDSVNVGENILKGLITKADMANNPAYGWYAESQNIYTNPSAAALAGMRLNKDNIDIVVFAGTWCEDSRFVVPKFFKLQQASGFPDSRMTIYAVDRSKKAIENVVEDYHVTLIPTIIIIKSGREVGRLEEFGKSGIWDKDFAEIFSE